MAGRVGPRLRYKIVDGLLKKKALIYKRMSKKVRSCWKEMVPLGHQVWSFLGHHQTARCSLSPEWNIRKLPNLEQHDKCAIDLLTHESAMAWSRSPKLPSSASNEIKPRAPSLVVVQDVNHFDHYGSAAAPHTLVNSIFGLDHSRPF